MRTTVGVGRLLLAALIVVAVAATFAATAARALIVPANFFGYFTVQANLLAVPVLATSGALLLRGARAPGWFDVARAAVATYLVIVGAVYALLLAPLGAEGGVPLPWANTVLHVISCLLVPLDWLLVTDRRRLSYRQVGWLLLYPAVWCVVVLIRGAVDGWVPYPFLDQSRGAGPVAIAVAGIAVAVLVAGLLVLAASRLRVLRLAVAHDEHGRFRTRRGGVPPRGVRNRPPEG